MLADVAIVHLGTMVYASTTQIGQTAIPSQRVYGCRDTSVGFFHVAPSPVETADTPVMTRACSMPCPLQLKVKLSLLWFRPRFRGRGER